MRLYVVYDPSGSITALSTHPEGAPEPVMELDRGEKSGFIDVPEIEADSPQEERCRKLKDLLSRYRVEEESAPQLRLTANSEAVD
jgi:hypothetical protein